MYITDLEKYIGLMAFADNETINEIIYTALYDDSINEADFHELLICAGQLMQ